MQGRFAWEGGLLGVRSSTISLTRWGGGAWGEGGAHAVVLLPGEGSGWLSPIWECRKAVCVLGEAKVTPY